MIEVGEYIRTIDGYIRKVISVNKKGTYEAVCHGAYSVDMKYKNSVGISAKKIKLHSKNIIDLIEVGDYVNGHKVYRIDSTNAISIETETNLYGIIYTEDIKTILTHEIYEREAYKIE